jgi:hypothetical protein
MKVRISKAEDRFGINIWIYDEKDGYREIWEPIPIVVRKTPLDSCEYIEPTFKLDEGTDFLQALSEALIEAGYRDKAVSKDGEISRLESHVSDLRIMLFKKLGITL